MRFAIVVALLAMAACKDRGFEPRRTVLSDSADQVYAGMTTTINRNGVRTSVVQADSAWMYDLRKVFDLKTMTVTMFDSSGAVVSRITADKGVYRIRDQHLDARGHVVATSSGGKVLKTEHLIFDNINNIISSDSAFTSTSPQGTITGAHFEADPAFKNVTVNQLKGVQKGKGIALPGQRGAGPP